MNQADAGTGLCQSDDDIERSLPVIDVFGRPLGNPRIRYPFARHCR